MVEYGSIKVRLLWVKKMADAQWSATIVDKNN